MLLPPVVSGQPAQTNLPADNHAIGENEDVGIFSLLHQKHTFRAFLEEAWQTVDTGTGIVGIVGLPALARHTSVAPGTMVAVIVEASIAAALVTRVAVIVLGPTA